MWFMHCITEIASRYNWYLHWETTSFLQILGSFSYMLCTTMKETHIRPFQQEIDNSSYMVFALIPSIVCCLQRNAAHGTQGLCCYLTVPTHLAQAWPPQQNRIAKRHTALCRIARRNAGIRLFTAGSIDALQELSTVYRARKSVCRKIVKKSL